MANDTAAWELPALPSYTLTPRPSLFPMVADKYTCLILPIVAYWAFSMLFHIIDTRDYFPQYRLHTPVEVLKRNRVSRWEVVRDVVVQQVVQTLFGMVLAMGEEDEFMGKEEYNVAVWAQRLRVAQRAIPMFLGAVGIDARALASSTTATRPILAGILMGGRYSNILDASGAPAFARWEVNAAKLIYWLMIPALQFFVAFCLVDTWQYFLHRAMHMNKWLYTTFHSRHHRLYVPYAYGALYNHPFEGFLLDTLGTGLAYLVVGMSPRQAICFFTGSTIKTVDDHCGYALPWDPLQHITSNNAGYHDVHHQSWGIKTNFSQPFFTFWDRALGTNWTGGDVSARYERARRAADRNTTSAADELTRQRRTSSLTGGKRPSDTIYNAEAARISFLASLEPAVHGGKPAAPAAPSQEQSLRDKTTAGAGLLTEEITEEASVPRATPRKRSTQSSASVQTGSLKGLRDRVAGGGGSFHGRTGGVLGYESSR